MTANSLNVSSTAPRTSSLIEYLSLSKVPWSLAYISFLCYFIVITTYVANIGAAMMATAILSLSFGSRRIIWPFPVWLLLAFWLWAALATMLSEFVGDIEPLIDLGKVILVFVVAVNVLWHRLTLRLFLLLYLACFTLYPVRGTLFNYFIYDHADFGRPSWIKLFGNPNDMASMTILALALAVGFLHKETPRTLRFASLLMCIVFPFVILLTQSRGVFVGTCVFLLLAILGNGRNRIKAIIAIVMIATVVIAFAPQAVWQRIAGLQNVTSKETIDKIDAEGSAAERWDILQTALRIASDHPYFGVGRGRSPAAHDIYNPKVGPKNLHNTYAEVLVETGIPGLALFLWLLISLLLYARHARKKAITLRESAEWRRLQLIEIGLCGYLVAGIWGSYAFPSLLYVYLAILFAQTVALTNLAEQTSKERVTRLQ